MTNRRNTIRRRSRSFNHRNLPSGFIKNYEQRLTIPSWEKMFIQVIGSMSLRRFREAKAMMNVDHAGASKVINWNDSAVEESFYHAKERFWCVVNGFPCDIPLPDPDMYNDENDGYAAAIDAQLMMELDSEYIDSGDEDSYDEDAGIIHNDVIPTGWGDEFNDATEHNNCGSYQDIIPTGWSDEFNDGIENHSSYKDIIPTGWGDEFNDTTEYKTHSSYKDIIPTGWVDEFNDRVENNISSSYKDIIPTGWGEEFEDGVIYNNIVSYKDIIPTGWGDEFNDATEHNNYGSYNDIITTGWGDEFNDEIINNSIVSYKDIIPTGWGDEFSDATKHGRVNKNVVYNHHLPCMV